MTLHAACSRLASVEDFNAVGCDCCLSDVDVIEDKLDYASDVLYVLSDGAVFGECQATLRPMRDCGCLGGYSGYGYCCHQDKIPLRLDATEIVSIKIDGLTLDPASYRLHGDGTVTKVSTSDRPPTPWPYWQHLWKPDTADHTFSITYKFGMREPYPAWVVDAAVEIACLSAKATHPNKGTKIPATTTQLFVGGANMTLERVADQIKQYGTSLPAVAQFIAMVNPGFKGNASVSSPDGYLGWTFTVDA